LPALLSAMLNAQLGRFLLVGVSNFLVSFGVFQSLLALLHYRGLAVSVYQLISYAAGIAWSFSWNRRFTFRSNAPWPKEGTRFVPLQALLAISSSLMIGVCVERFELSPTTAWFVVMAIITAANFLLCRYWVFASSRVKRS